MRRLLPLLLLLGMAGTAASHEVRPAYLELRETDPGIYRVLWKVPSAGDRMRLALDARLPEGCEAVGPAQDVFVGGAHVRRWAVRAPAGGLAEGTITIDGLAATITDVLVRIEHRDGAMQVVRLTPARPSMVVAGSPGAFQVMGSYLHLGIEHILTGYDHLLFVLALILVTRGGWMLLKAVTAFTVSHTVTLTLATFDLVRLPQAPVEAVIALSIVFVALEILNRQRGRPGLTARAPWVASFAFGLLHGLGFAGALGEAGLPQGHIPLALLFFSLGVETGHVLFVSAVLALAAAARRLPLKAPAWAPLVPPYAIGAVALFWLVERIAGF